MATRNKKEPLGKPRQMRFPKDLEADLNKIAEADGIEYVQVVRQAARLGAAALKKRMLHTVQEAA
ncbi:MAG: hypothetical protein JWQ04_2827 [Pedosphaera sp.]|nr:hypothetical protein [Pedosphaera sp.]